MWLIEGFALADAAVLALLMVAYVFFMVKAPDALRSEKYSILKTAMEKRLVGDSLTGLREAIVAYEDAETKLLGSDDAGSLGPGK